MNENMVVEAAQVINSIITEPQYKNATTISPENIEFTRQMLGDRKTVVDRKVTIDSSGETTINVSIRSERILSNILFDIYYPKIQESTFYHYTKISALKNILKGELKFKPIAANENFNEFKTFYLDHNILGYFENKDNNGTIMNDSLMKDIYALCMASKVGLTAEKEDSLWSSFADQGHGVRIEFEIKSTHPDFRRVFYRGEKFNKSELVINKLRKEIARLYGKELYIPGISKIGAFYLPGIYGIENEVRFVIKKHTDEYDFYYDDSKGYLMIPFKNKYGEFKINKIKIGNKCSLEQREEITQMLRDNNYSDDIIE